MLWTLGIKPTPTGTNRLLPVGDNTLIFDELCDAFIFASSKSDDDIFLIIDGNVECTNDMYDKLTVYIHDIGELYFDILYIGGTPRKNFIPYHFSLNAWWRRVCHGVYGYKQPTEPRLSLNPHEDQTTRNLSSYIVRNKFVKHILSLKGNIKDNIYKYRSRAIIIEIFPHLCYDL